jgi:hypothetical protein
LDFRRLAQPPGTTRNKKNQTRQQRINDDEANTAEAKKALSGAIEWNADHDIISWPLFRPALSHPVASGRLKGFVFPGIRSFG